MGIATPVFSPVAASLYLTFGGRVLDARSPRSVLRDTTASEIAEKIGYDTARFALPATKVFDVAVRAKMLDDVVRGFVARHLDAVVVDLGAGLDTRAWRVAAPPTVDFYDIDLPEVIEARRQVMPERANVHAVAADLTDSNCLDAVPGDRPAVIVADGLVPFLSQDDLVALLRRLTGQFPSGELAFNSYSTFNMWVIHHLRSLRSIAEVSVNPGFNDPREPERWGIGLTFVEEHFETRRPEIALLPPVLRLSTRLLSRSAALSRWGITVFHYRF
jgi:O-methyltransferase involved in polyketide biosynthesis